MRLKSILFFNVSLLLFSFAALLVTVANNDPDSSSLPVYLIFYLSLLITLWSILTLGIFFAKSRMSNNQLTYSLYLPSARQSLFLSLALTVVLFLKGLKILDWWIGISILIAFIFLELFFETKKFRQASKDFR